MSIQIFDRSLNDYYTAALRGKFLTDSNNFKRLKCSERIWRRIFSTFGCCRSSKEKCLKMTLGKICKAADKHFPTGLDFGLYAGRPTFFDMSNTDNKIFKKLQDHPKGSFQDNVACIADKLELFADKDLYTKLVKSLKNDHETETIKIDGLKIKKKAHDLSLEGSVETQEEKEKVEQVTRRIPGLETITNNLDVNFKSYYNGKILSIFADFLHEFVNKLKENPNLFAYYPQNDSQVHRIYLSCAYKDPSEMILEGCVKSETDKEDIEKVLLRVNGVKKVNNQLSVKAPQS